MPVVLTKEHNDLECGVSPLSESDEYADLEESDDITIVSHSFLH